MAREEEVLEDASLSDLPVLNTSPTKEEEEEKTKNKLTKNKNNQLSVSNYVVSEPQVEFAFGSANGSSSSLCAAEDVFFRGQILPLRSDAPILARPEPNRIPARSKSTDQAGFRRSAHNDAPIAISGGVASAPRQRAPNQFHAHPSPKPHVRASRSRSVKSKHKSSMWDFFRLGLVRTPELELQEQKAVSLRNPMSRSSSGSNSDNSKNHHTNKTISSSTRSRKSGSGTVVENSQNRMKFLSGCTCSAESVASNIAVVVKTKGTGSCNNINAGSDDFIVTKLEEVLLLENLSSINEKSKTSGRSDDYYYYYHHDDQNLKKQYLKEQGRRRKQAVSHHRTYEWLNELSHANLPMHV